MLNRILSYLRRKFIVTQVVTVYRLDEATYKKLEAGLPNALVDSSISELQAGQKLGVQLVLRQLREGFVVK